MRTVVASRRLRRALSAGVGLFVGLCGARAHAQCMTDMDCKGERVCESGSCVALPAAAPSPPSRAALAPSVVRPPPPTPAPAPAPRMVRHSTGMMVGGIVTLGVAPVGLAVAGFGLLSAAFCGAGDAGSRDPDRCVDAEAFVYGGLLATAALVAIGVPLVVIGAKKEPASVQSTAVASPWIGSHSAGLSLKFSL